nr:MAG: putative capsid protein 3 [Polycipiviridae sp.]
MNNEEPQLTQIANLQISHEGHKLPEQSQVAETSIPRPFSFINLINQWQPMGIRVVLNLPFIGNDKDFLFAIRNGPFIPRFDKTYLDYAMPDSTSGLGISNEKIQSYGFNNMRNVIHGKHEWSQLPSDTKEAVYITYYDYPPILSMLSTMFRKWRGAMEYRIRVVSGFSTQGYLIAGMLKNVPSHVGVFNAYKVMSAIPRQDASYREIMQNSYIMSDTSMFRHFKIHVPYEYPSPWYDQFNWIANRSRPSKNFYLPGPSNGVKSSQPVMNEPHGDNFIVIGMRGALNTSVNQAQISFELEYRAVEGFQFADPGLPLGDFLYPYDTPPVPANNPKVVTFPAVSNPPNSDGIGIPHNVNLLSRAAFDAIPASRTTARRVRPRMARSVDVEDSMSEYDDYEEPKPNEPLDHGPGIHPLDRLNNLRKNLHTRSAGVHSLDSMEK